MKKVSVLVPVLNEQANIEKVYTAISSIFLSSYKYIFEIIFIDDGSTDNTLSLVKDLAGKYPNIIYLSFSRNFGKDNALSAGFNKCSGDAVITMDGDMQHAPDLIRQLLTQWENGYEVVYYYREQNNQHASFFSKQSSRSFYKTLNFLADVKLENGISDFRLLDKKVVSSLLLLKEDNLFYRGLIKWVGFKQLGLPYNPQIRNAGNSTYKTRMLFKLAIESITSFSTKPLTVAIYLGFVFSLIALMFIPYAIYSKYTGVSISGWASVIVAITFFGGLNLMILGIVGLYLGKTFIQGKGRPLYIIRESNI